MLVHNPTGRFDQRGTNLIRMMREKIYGRARSEADQLRTLTRIFKQHCSDASVNARLDLEDFRHMIRVIVGINPADDEIEPLFEAMANPYDGLISLREFQLALLQDRAQFKHVLDGKEHVDRGLNDSGSHVDYEGFRGGARAPRAKDILRGYYEMRKDKDPPTMPDVTPENFFTEVARRFFERPCPHARQQLRLQLKMTLREFDHRGDGRMNAEDFRFLLHTRMNLKASKMTKTKKK